MMLHSKARQFSVGYSLKSKRFRWFGQNNVFNASIIGNNLFAFTKTSF
jgi:hypothetical protein